MMVYDEESLDADLRKTNSQFNATVKRHVLAWVEKYKQHKDFALTSLISLIFRACKCPFKVTINMPVDTTWKTNLEGLEKEMGTLDPKTVPDLDEAIVKGINYAKNLSDLIEHILQKSQNDILTDGYFSPNILQALDALSKSSVRGFRHGSTLIALRMTTVLSRIMKSVVIELSTCSQQLSIERAKPNARKSSERIENLETTFNTLDQSSSKIEEQIKFIHKQIINPRFRDIFSEIRLACLAELQVWLSDFKNYYLNPRSLEHVRNLLCDSNITVITGALKIAKWIFSTCQFAEIEIFTAAIVGSIVKLSIHSKPNISSLAIQVASAIVEQNTELINKEAKDFIMYLVYSPEHQVSKIAGEFIHQLVMKDHENEAEYHPNFPVIYLLKLKDFIIKSKGSEKVALLVESMLSVKNNYLMEWKSYIELLLMDELKIEAPHLVQSIIDDERSSLNSTEEGIIICLMLNSLKQVLTQERPRQEISSKARPIWKTPTQRKTESAKIMEYLLASLPKIIRKFMPEKSKIIDLLSICLIMKSCHFKRTQDIIYFGEVFKQLLNTHTDFEVHIKCAKVLTKLSEGNALFTLNVCNPCLEQITNMWRKSMQLYCVMRSMEPASPLPQNLEEEKRNVIFTITKNFSNLLAFSYHFSLEEYVDFDELVELSLGRLREAYTVPSQVMEYSFKTIHVIVLRLAADDERDDELFKARVEEFCALGSQVLQGEFKCSIRHSAFMCLTENICMLRSLMETSPAWVKNCWEAVTIAIVKYFSAMVCKKDGLDELSRKDEEDSIAVYLSLIKRRVLPQRAVFSILMYHTKELIMRFSGAVKETMSIVQSWGMEDFAITILEVLSSGYEDILCQDECDNAKKNELFEELVELATHLMKEYGADLAKHKKAALKLHLHGIDFTTEMRENFVNPLFAAPFAVILNVFPPIVDPKDRRILGAHLAKRIKIVKRKSFDLRELDQIMHYIGNISSRSSSHNTERKHLTLRSRKNLQEEMDLQNSMEVDSM